MDNKKIAVVGAGITGLTTSYYLKKKGIDVELFDRRAEPGGVIRTSQHGDWRYENGPNTLLVRDSEVEEFIDELNLTAQIESANLQASKRFIVRNGRLHIVPTSVKEFLKTSLFSFNGKFRLLGEPFPGRSEENVSLARFFEHRFGREILDYALNPFVAGIHAGRPEELSLKHSFPLLYELEKSSGSVILGAIKKMFQNRNNSKIPRRLISFSEGLQQLPHTIFSKLDKTFLNHTVNKILKTQSGWTLKTGKGDFGPYTDVVCTVPLTKWDDELLPVSKKSLQILQGVYHPPLSVMILGYKESQIDHPLDGFGFLVPEKENRSILGALFTSTLFRNRAPDGYHLITVFVGGSRQPDLAQLASDQLLSDVEKDLEDLLGLTGSAVYKEHIYWPSSIPQYHPGYDEVLQVFEELESKNPGLHVAGNFRSGISIPDCIKNGIKLAQKIGG